MGYSPVCNMYSLVARAVRHLSACARVGKHKSANLARSDDTIVGRKTLKCYIIV